MKISQTLATLSLVALMGSATSVFAEVLFSQPADLNGTALASQNDLVSLGNFATGYDNFTLGSNASITGISFTGKFFNPASHGNITGFTVSFWADSVGQPGGLLHSSSISGNASETFLGNHNSFPTYEYTASLGAFGAMAGTQYWISVVPDLVFPPQWGWATASIGDGVGYQDFLGARSQVGSDFAFTLTGSARATVPESGTTVALLGAVFSGLVLLRRRSAA